MHKIISSALFLALTSAVSLSAAVTVNFSGNPADGSAAMTIDQVDFEISTASNFNQGVYVIFDDVFTDKSGYATVTGSNLGGSMSFAVNGSGSIGVDFWQDGGASLGAIDPNDHIFGYFSSTDLALEPGDIVSVSGDLQMLASNASFELPASGQYEMFLANGSGSIISEQAVPEPSTVALLAGLGALGFALYRRRM